MVSLLKDRQRCKSNGTISQSRPDINYPYLEWMKLYIANKKYSSWSFRPWFAMGVSGIQFEEILRPFEMDSGNAHFEEFSPTGKVPCLVDGETTLWESLAILEYLADKYPAKNLWPSDQKARAIARAIFCEMLGGFVALRNECPMNMAREIKPLTVSDQVKRDVKRIEQIWDECLQASGGPYLFGDFTNADAMFAPVVNRFEVYVLSNSQVVHDYSLVMKSTDAWQEWEKAGRAEPWVVAEDEA